MASLLRRAVGSCAAWASDLQGGPVILRMAVGSQVQFAHMTDRIRLNEMVFYGYHGVLEAERQLGQRFVVDVEMHLDLASAGQTDDLKQTVNYASVFDLVREIVTGPPRMLIEAVAESVAARILAEHALVQRVEVRIRKPAVPIPGSVLASSEVWIERHRPVPVRDRSG